VRSDSQTRTPRLLVLASAFGLSAFGCSEHGGAADDDGTSVGTNGGDTGTAGGETGRGGNGSTDAGEAGATEMGGSAGTSSGGAGASPQAGASPGGGSGNAGFGVAGDVATGGAGTAASDGGASGSTWATAGSSGRGARGGNGGFSGEGGSGGVAASDGSGGGAGGGGDGFGGAGGWSSGGGSKNVNECATRNGDCHPLTTCTETNGGRTCGACPSGLSGDGNTGCGCTPSEYGIIPAATADISALAIAKNGQKLYAYSQSTQALLVYDAVTLEPITSIDVGFDSVLSMVIDDTYHKLFVGPFGGTTPVFGVAVVDTTSDTLLDYLADSATVVMTLDPARHRVYATAGGVVSIDVATNAVTPVSGTSTNIYTALTVNPNTSDLLVGNWSQANDQLLVVDPDTLTVTRAIDDFAGFGLGFNPNENKVYVSYCKSAGFEGFCVYDFDDDSVHRFYAYNDATGNLLYNPVNHRMHTTAEVNGVSSVIQGPTDEWFNLAVGSGGGLSLAVRETTGNVYVAGARGTYVFNKDVEFIKNFSDPADLVVVAEQTGLVYATDGGDIHVYQDPDSCPITPWPSHVQLAGGDSFLCRLNSDSNVLCLGDLPESNPGGLFRKINAGGFHVCGLRYDDSVACWGYDTAVAGTPLSGTFRDIAATMYGACAIRMNGNITCWGLTSGTPPTGTYRSIAGGYMHACAIADDDTVHCWGTNAYGETTAPNGAFSQVDAGNSFTCGLRPNGSIECWGDDSDGRSAAPSGTFTKVSAATGSSGNHACGLRPSGDIECWGDNSFDQTEVESGPFIDVATSSLASCGTRPDGTPRCWGVMR
jgi:hypothetical protein